MGYEERDASYDCCYMCLEARVCSLISLEQVELMLTKVVGQMRPLHLHCAVAKDFDASHDGIKLLLDVNGNRSCDLILSVANGNFDSRKRMLQAILEGTDGIHEQKFLADYIN